MANQRYTDTTGKVVNFEGSRSECYRDVSAKCNGCKYCKEEHSQYTPVVNYECSLPNKDIMTAIKVLEERLADNVNKIQGVPFPEDALFSENRSILEKISALQVKMRH